MLSAETSRLVHTFLRQGPASAAVHFSMANRAFTTPVVMLFCTPPVLAPVSYKATAQIKADHCLYDNGITTQTTEG